MADPSSTVDIDESPLPQGPGPAFTFLYYFAGTAAVTTFLALKILGLPLETGIPNQFGLLFGAIGGTLGTIFNRTTTLELPYPSRRQFQSTLEDALTTMGYTATDLPPLLAEREDCDRLAVYRRSALRQLFSGRIYVYFGAKAATVSSRAVHIRRLNRQLAKSSE